jgi:hypothetical protein
MGYYCRVSEVTVDRETATVQVHYDVINDDNPADEITVEAGVIAHSLLTDDTVDDDARRIGAAVLGHFPDIIARHRQRSPVATKATVGVNRLRRALIGRRWPPPLDGADKTTQ